MKIRTVEIKARCDELDKVRTTLREHHADFRGLDHQTDTYFIVPHGRLKLREGDIENALIYYEREDQPGPKESKVMLAPTLEGPAFRQILQRLFDVKVVVEKQREIYYMENIKIHLDSVTDLGTFVEIEAIGVDMESSRDVLLKQCEDLMKTLRIEQKDLVIDSYSDLLRGLSAGRDDRDA